jgi:hypothetical protein
MAHAVMFVMTVLCASTKIFCILSRLVRNWIFLSFPGFDVGSTEPWETNVDYASRATQPILVCGLEHLHQRVDSPALAYSIGQVLATGSLAKAGSFLLKMVGFFFRILAFLKFF